jgi:hypothetical protein
MEREVLQAQAELKAGKATIRCAIAAAAIWAAVLYSLVGPAPPHRPVRMVVALAPCQP